MARHPFTLVAATFVLFLVFAHPAAAFGAGNIASLSRIEGQNFRHGDIEDVLLGLIMARAAGGKKFGKLDVLRVYFGNWLRDYSQAVDVGTVKYVSAEAIRLLIWVLGFMTFGYGTGEFEVTTDRLGCYQPTEHIDNPLGYADGDDARRYDRRLRGPVDTRRELSIDPRTGMKNYIAAEDAGINTSAGLIRRVLGQCIDLGRRYARSGNQEELYEALRLLGTGLHCLEDFSAHSNYTELSLVELGEREIFPHVGRNTMIELEGAREPVYPLVTGTFGGVDFLHSVMGEVSDKTTQSEIQGLEGVIQESQNDGSSSFIQELLNKIPAGILGGGDDNSGKMEEFQANAQQAQQQQQVSPLEPEEWANYLNDVHQRIYPVIEWHDNLLKSISQAIEKIPVLPDLIEQIQDQLNLFVFSILAPYVLPIINQIKTELETGSSEVIQSSKKEQHNIFNDDDATDPTHSMLSKDHFSNVLNEPAGKIAQAVVGWAVPQIMQCWDDESINVDRTINRIISGVFHHPAQRDFGNDGAADARQAMFGVVQQWWGEQDDSRRDSLRRQLSRRGVQQGLNHKDGVSDCGHGSGKPMTVPGKGKSKKNKKSSGGSSDPFGGYGGSGSGGSDYGKMAEKAVGGGVLGSLVGGFVAGAASGLGDDNGRDNGDDYKEKKKEKKYKHHEEDSREEKKKEKKYKHHEEDSREEKKEKKYKHHKEDGEDESSSRRHGRSDHHESSYNDGSSGRYQQSSGAGYEGGYSGQSGYQRDNSRDRTSGYGQQYGGGRSEGYSQSGGYGQQSGGYSQSGGYGQQTGGYSQQSSGYGQQSGGYGSRDEGYGQQSGGYSGGRSEGYEQSGGYNQSSSGYGQQTSGYGQQSREYQSQTSGYGQSESYGGGYGGSDNHRQQQQYGSGGDSYGRRRSKSRSRSRERQTRNYESSHYGRDERRHESRERDEDSHQRRYKKHDDEDNDDDSDSGRRRHRRGNHHRKRSSS